MTPASLQAVLERPESDVRRASSPERLVGRETRITEEIAERDPNPLISMQFFDLVGSEHSAALDASNPSLLIYFAEKL